MSAWSAPATPSRVDVHIDLLRWRGPPRFAGAQRVLGRLTWELRKRRLQERWQDPIGLLTHHLVHDDATWRFLNALLHFEPLKRAARWPTAETLFGLDRPNAAAGKATPEEQPQRDTAARDVCGQDHAPSAPQPFTGRAFDPSPWARKALICALAIMAAWTIRWGLSPLLNAQSPYVTFALASLIAALCQDLTTGIAAMFLGGLIANYSFVGRPGMLDFSGSNIWDFTLFMVTTLAAIFLIVGHDAKGRATSTKNAKPLALPLLPRRRPFGLGFKAAIAWTRLRQFIRPSGQT